MHEKLKAHTARHSLLYTISAVLLLFVIMAATFNYRTIITTRKAFYTATLERQSLNNLNLYQEGSSTLVKSYFSDLLGFINNLAASATLQQKMSANQSALLLSDLNQQRTISDQFDSLTAISAQGKMLAISTNTGGVAPGVDETQSPAFTAGKAASSTVLINVHYSQLNRNVFSIAAPVKDKNGQFLGTISGAVTLDTLAQHIHLSSQYDAGFNALLTDSAGNALVWQNKAQQIITNYIRTEPTLKALTKQTTVPANEEYNFNQTDSFAQGDTINFGSAGKLYLVSFYDVNGYKQHINEAIQDINSSFSSFIIRDGLFLITLIGIIGFVIRTHEKRRS
jgi:hypothetical protein